MGKRRQAKEQGVELQPAPPTQTPPPKENQEGLNRATYEAYAAIALAAIAVVFDLVWWWKAIFALAIVVILVDISFNSKITIKQGRRRYM